MTIEAAATTRPQAQSVSPPAPPVLAPHDAAPRLADPTLRDRKLPDRRLPARKLHRELPDRTHPGRTHHAGKAAAWKVPAGTLAAWKLPTHKIRTLALLGLLGSCLVVLTGGRTAQKPEIVVPFGWLGLLGPNGPRGDGVALGSAELLGVLLLVTSWWRLLAAADRLRRRAVMLVAVMWSVPLVLGPPLLSLDVYSYLAQGRVSFLARGPYRSPPSVLPELKWVGGVDTLWRNSLSPYGPLAALLERAATVTGSPALGLVLLHLLAVACIAVLTYAACRLTTGRPGVRALLLTAANPLLLLHVLGAAHWEALIAALLACALLLFRRGYGLAAIALASTAAAVKLPVGFAAVVLLLLHVRQLPAARRAVGGLSAVAAVVVPWLLLALVVPDAWGFLRGLGGPMTVRTLQAPTTLLAEVATRVARSSGLPVSFGEMLSVCRLAGLVAAALVCLRLLLTSGQRSPERSIGLGLLAIALLGPVLYPWYIAWGLVPLALEARDTRALAVLSTVMVFPSVPGFASLERLVLTAPAARPVLALAVLALLAVVGRRVVGRTLSRPLPPVEATVDASELAR